MSLSLGIHSFFPPLEGFPCRCLFKLPT
jgi:hypothetical protein